MRFVRGTSGQEWAFALRPLNAGEIDGDVMGAPINDLVADETQVDLMKIDIEGAEVEVLEGGTPEWLCRTRNLVLELHGESPGRR